MTDKLSELIQVRLNAIDRLGLNPIQRRASAHVYGEWKERALALEQRVEGLEDSIHRIKLWASGEIVTISAPTLLNAVVRKCDAALAPVEEA